MENKTSNGLSKETMEALIQLAKNEPDGIERIINTLFGQMADLWDANDKLLEENRRLRGVKA